MASCKLFRYAGPDGSRCRELEACSAQPLARGASLSQLLAALQPPGVPALDALTLKRTSAEHCSAPALLPGGPPRSCLGLSCLSPACLLRCCPAVLLLIACPYHP